MVQSSMLQFIEKFLGRNTGNEVREVTETLGGVELESSPETLRNILSFADRAGNDPTLLKCLIKAIGKKRQYELIMALPRSPIEMNDKRVPRYTFMHYLFAHADAGKIHSNTTLSLGRDVILPWPWDEGRYLDNLKNIGTDVSEPWIQDSNHRVCWVLPLEYGFVNNGNHSIMTGIMKEEGNIKAQAVFDLALVYPDVELSADGCHFIYKGLELYPIKDFDMAAAFELGRRLVKITSDSA